MRRFVAYFRVSTARQGRSGLGIEAQREAVLQYINGNSEVLAEFVEHESGRKADRPELAKALRHCRATGATLIVARLDRLARDVAFLSGVMNSSVEFVVCDFPDANRLTLHVMAAVAEYEARRIGDNTRAALKVAKARGVKLGNPNGAAALRRAAKGNAAAVAARRAQTAQRASDLREMVEDIRSSGITSLSGIAAELNLREARTPQGKQWHPASVARLLARL